MKEPTKWISRERYYQALGLFTVGRNFTEKADEAVQELRAVLKEKDEWGHANDAVYGSRTFPELLKLLGYKGIKPKARKRGI